MSEKTREGGNGGEQKVRWSFHVACASNFEAKGLIGDHSSSLLPSCTRKQLLSACRERQGRIRRLESAFLRFL